MKYLQKALKQSDDVTRLIMNSALDAIICINTSGEIIVWTQQAEKVFGWSERESLGKQLSDTIIPAQYKQSHINGFKNYLETGEGPILNKIIEMTAINRKGVEFPVELTIVPLKQGEEVFFCSFIRDITKRKKAEQELHESELRYRSLIDQASDAIMITDTKGNFSDVNSSLCKLFGYTREELLKSNISAVIDPEQLKYDPIRFDILMSGKGMLRERRMKHKDGTIIEVEANIKMLPDGRVLAIARDITDRKKTEAKIEASEKKLRQVLSSTPDNFYVIDRSYNVILINETAEKNLEKAWRRPVKIGTNLLDVIPDTDEPIKQSFEKVFSGERIEYELQVTGADLPAWVLVSYLPVHDETGAITGAYVIAKDISSRKNAEQAIKESEERYRTLVENAPEALVVLDVEKGKFVSVSESAVKLFKMSKEELLKLGPINLSPEFQPDGKLSSEAGFEMINKAVAGEKPNFEWTHRDAEGNLIPCEVRLVRLPSENQILVRGSIIDITDRKKAQELVIRERDLSDSIINSLPGVFYLRSLSTGKCLRWNKNFETVLEYTSREVAESILYDCIVEKDRGFVKQTVDEAFKKGEGVAVETEIITKSGKQLPYYLTGIPIIYENELCLMGTGIDITERKKAQELVIKERDLSDSIINTLPGVFFLRSLETGKLLRWNKNFETVTGRSKEEIAESKLLEYIAEEDKKYIGQKIETGLNTGYAEAEAHIASKDGRKTPYFLTGITIMYEGQRCILGTGIDISARKKAEEELRESEQKYKLLFESNPLPMFMFSRDDFSILDVNESAIRHYGFSKEEFLEMKATDLRPQEDVSKFLEKVTTSATGAINLGIWNHKKKNETVISVEIIGYDIVYQDKPARLTLANDVTEKLAAEEKLKQSYNEVRRLTNHLQNIREEERTHIAREIHDELGQQLTVLKMDASWLNKRLSSSDAAAKEKLRGLLDLLDGTVKTVRRISSELRPSLLDDLGLIAAIEWHLKEFKKRSGIQTNFLTDEADLSLPDEVKTGLFRILQESLTNIARHAEAREVKVTLHIKNDELILSIEDDGRGFDKFEVAGKKTLGVLGMEERSEMMGGNYQINSRPGEGTVVTVSIPFKLEVNHQ
jgi:PAS domain S-box-containing protein